MPRKIDKRVQRARNFRQNPTDAERKLWQRLRQFPSLAVHFRRQATIGFYFADCACHTTRIVIEIDGGQDAGSASDKLRTTYLNNNGYCVLRFWNNDVLTNIEGVMESIANAVAQILPTPDPSPPREECVGGGERLTPDSLLPSPRSCGGEGSGVGGASHPISKDDALSGGNA